MNRILSIDQIKDLILKDDTTTDADIMAALTDVVFHG